MSEYLKEQSFVRMCYPENPDSFYDTVGDVSISGERRLVYNIGLNAKPGTRIVVSNIVFSVTHRSDTTNNMNIELYSGDFSTVSFNKLKNNYTKYEWSDGVTKLPFTWTGYIIKNISLNDYLDIISEAISSSGDTIIALQSDEGSGTISGSGYPAKITIEYSEIETNVVFK